MRDREQFLSAQERFNSIERAVINKLGLIEVLPGEKDRVVQIRWSAEKSLIALRLGEEGKYIFDPEENIDLSNNDLEIRFSDFRTNLANVLQGESANFSESFSSNDQILLNGIIRRVINYPGAKEIINEHLESSDHNNLRWLHAVMEKELEQLSVENVGVTENTPDILVVAHRKIPEFEKLLSKVGGKSEPDSVFKRKMIERIRDTLQLLIFTSCTPYLGATVIAAELEENGFDKLKLLDYGECIDGSLAYANPTNRNNIALLTGVISTDIRDLASTTVSLKEKGYRPICGGLAPSIDPYAVSLSTKADVFIGESEGAMNYVIEIVNKINSETPGKRIIFHRGGIGDFKNQKYVLRDDNVHADIIHAYLNLPNLVDLDSYYDPKKEKSGNLCRRMKHESSMKPSINMFGREFDPPPWLLNQLIIKVGCPSKCPFCSTAEIQGKQARKMPSESVKLKIRAMNGKAVIVLDQNLGGINHDETLKEWYEYMNNIFETFQKNGKRVFYQTDPEFYDRLDDNEELLGMASDTTAALLIGVEQPKKIRGTSVKDPDQLRARLKVAKKMQSVVVGTAIVGLPAEFSAGNSSNQLTEDEWVNFLIQFPEIQAMWMFPFIEFPGAVSISPTSADAADPLAAYKHLSKSDADTVLMNKINADYYSMDKIFKRLIDMRGYRKGRLLIALILNMGMWSMSKAGMSTKDYLKKVRV